MGQGLLAAGHEPAVLHRRPSDSGEFLSTRRFLLIVFAQGWGRRTHGGSPNVESRAYAAALGFHGYWALGMPFTALQCKPQGVVHQVVMHCDRCMRLASREPSCCASAYPCQPWPSCCPFESACDSRARRPPSASCTTNSSALPRQTAPQSRFQHCCLSEQFAAIA